jgi:hypothetical protein
MGMDNVSASNQGQGNWWDAAVHAAGDAAKAVGDAAKGAADAVGQAAQGAADAVKQTVNGAVDAVQQAIPGTAGDAAIDRMQGQSPAASTAAPSSSSAYSSQPAAPQGGASPADAKAQAEAAQRERGTQRTQDLGESIRASATARQGGGDVAAASRALNDQVASARNELQNNPALTNAQRGQLKDFITQGQAELGRTAHAREGTAAHAQLQRTGGAIDATTQQLDAFAARYQQQADGKAGIQKAMDWGRQFVNEGYGDDQFKNIGKTREALAELKGKVDSGAISAADAKAELSRIQTSFDTEAQRVTQAQAENAKVGQAVHGAGRMAAVTLAGIGATAATGGNVFVGFAAGTAAGAGYDALTVAADKLDGANSSIAPQLNVNQSLGGVAARAVSGEQITQQQLIQGTVGTLTDGANGAFAAQGVASAKAAQLGVQQVAAQTGQQASRFALGSAAAKANVLTGLAQTGTNYGLQNTGIALDPTLNQQQKEQKIAENTQRTLAQLPGQVAFGAAGSYAGVAGQVSNRALDTTVQLGVDTATNLGQTSLSNALEGRGFGLSRSDVASAVVQGVPGAVQNIAQRVPQQDSVTQSDLDYLSQAPMPDLAPLLGDFAPTGTLEQTMRAHGVEPSTRPTDPRAGEIVMSSLASGGTGNDGGGLSDRFGQPLPSATEAQWQQLKSSDPEQAQQLRDVLTDTAYSGSDALARAQQLGISPLQAAQELAAQADPQRLQQPASDVNAPTTPLTDRQVEQLRQQATQRGQEGDLHNQLTQGGRFVADPDNPNKQYWAKAGQTDGQAIDNGRTRVDTGWMSGDGTGYPGQHRDVHQHHDPASVGSYDPLFVMPRDNLNQLMDPLQRLLNLGQGNQTTVNLFPVAPGLNPALQFPYGQRGSEGQAGAYYYGMQNTDFRPMIGTATHQGDGLWSLEAMQSDLYRGQRIELPHTLVTQSEIEQTLGRPLPEGLDRFQFATLPINCHAGMSYRGGELDPQLMQATLALPPEQRARVFQGITAGDPFGNHSDRQVWDTLRSANELERGASVPVGTLQINGFGEITIAKELVMQTAGSNPLFLSGADELAHLNRYLSTMEQAGGLAIIHSDAGSSPSLHGRVPMLPTDYANISRLEEVITAHPDLQVIWAHGGGLDGAPQPGSGHLDMLRGMLDRHDNLKIDMSWDVINAYVVQSPQAMRDWAQLVHEHPDRFIFGSDSVGAGVNPNADAQFSGINMLAQAGLFNELNALDVSSGRESRSTTAKLLFGNFDDTIPAAADRLSQWRADPRVQQWLDQRGYERGEPPPVTYQRDDEGRLRLLPNTIETH